MTDILPRLMMVVVERWLGSSHREWGLAMQLEFGAATAEGRGLSFAAGCLLAAFRELPRHHHGQFALINHALTLGVLVPMAALHILSAAGLPSTAGIHSLLDHSHAQNPYLARAQLAAVPSLLIIWLVLGAAHLRLAWVLLDRDWSRAWGMVALIVAATATLAIYTSVLFLDDGAAVLQATASIIVLMVLAAAKWTIEARERSWEAIVNEQGR